MKHYEKIAIVMLCIAVITTVLSVSVCAEETYTLSGKWEFNEVLSAYPTSEIVLQKINFTIPDYFESTSTGNRDNSFEAFYQSSGNIMFSSKVNWTIYESATGWTSWGKSIRYVDFGETPQTVSSIFYNWFTSNATLYNPICDGTCAVPDENLDGICEDCGQPFSLRNTGYAYTHFVKFNSADGIIEAEYMSNEPFTIRGYKYGATYRVEPSIGVNCIAYLNGEITYQGVVANHYPSRNLDDTIVSSTFDWYTSIDSDEIFFPLPLWAVVETAAQGEMMETTLPTMGGTMRILVVCGVGLMACLVVLSLFGKRSLIFRN